MDGIASAVDFNHEKIVPQKKNRLSSSVRSVLGTIIALLNFVKIVNEKLVLPRRPGDGPIRLQVC